MSLALFGCSAGGPREITPAALGERLTAVLLDAPAPGGQVVAFGPSGPIAAFSAGSADLAQGRDVTGDTAFLWFSTTKLLTATAVMQLAEQRLVGLDEPVRTYLPGFLPGTDGAERITLRQLLSHSAGLPNPVPVTWIHLADEPGPSLDVLAERHLAAGTKLEDPPGARSRYSNLGYLVLGQVIERVSGESYADYVRRHILEPLGMTRSRFALDPAAAPVAVGYSRTWSLMGLLGWWLVDARFFDGRQGPYTALRPFLVDGAPYGGLVAPAGDMARFFAAHLNGGALHGRRVLSAESVAAMQQRQPLADGTPGDYGLGWHLGRVGGEPTVFHEGGGGGFHAEVRLYPQRGYGVVAVGNETSFPAGELMRLIVRAP